MLNKIILNTENDQKSFQLIDVEYTRATLKSIEVSFYLSHTVSIRIDSVGRPKVD